MPIVEIRALPQAAGVDPALVCARVCRDLAHALGCPEREVWAVWETLAPGAYVEGSVPAAAQPRDTHPPMIRILSMEGKDDALVVRMLETVSASVAAALPIDADNVFARYEELRSGRVAWGGRVRA